MTSFLLWSTIFCIGLHEAFAAVHTMQLGYTEPLKLRLQREGKLPEYLRRKNEFLSSKANNLASANQPLVDFDDMAYFGFITLGTPQQRFVAFIDTGSSDTWMPDVTCSAGQQTCGLYCDIVPYESCITFCPSKCCKQSRGIDLDKIFANKDDGCGAKSKFNSSASSTYTAGSGTFDLSYQTGEVKGFWGQDTFCIVNSSFCVTNQAFGQAQSITGGFVVQPIDGILGLAWPSLAFNGNKPPVFNGVDQGVLDQPLFTVFMTQNGATVTNGGAITYGAIDGVNCESAISYTPVTSTTFWQFKLLGVAAGDYSRQGSWDAISDTAATFIGGPTAIVQALAQAVGATYNQQGNSYEIDCDAQIPDIVFTIGGKAFSITPVNFIMALGPGPCQFAFFAQDGGGFYPAWMLGPPFIREFCQIYDIGNQRLGLAAHKSTLRNE